MKIYARVQSGVVAEIIAPAIDGDGKEIPIADRFHPDFVATLVDVTGIQGIQPGWDYDGTTFTAAVPYVESPATILTRALTEVRQQRAPILDALAGIAGRASRAGDAATASAADQASTDLLNITVLPALLAATTYDDMKAAVMTEYRRIAAAAPASVQTAFVEVFAS